MFYLTTHSKTVYLRLCGVGRTVKDHSDSERKPAAATWATLCDESKVFNMHHSSDRIAHTTAFVTPVVDFWLEREIARFALVLLRLKRGSYRQTSEFVVIVILTFT